MPKEVVGKKVAIVFLARDCARTLPEFLKKIERLRLQFADSRVFIVENGSKDSTRNILINYRSSHHSITFYTFDDPEFDRLSRIERMAWLRNKNLDMVRESEFSPDYYIVIDSDLDFELESIVRSIQRAPDNWAAIFANGRYYLKVGFLRIPVLYYDLFAYLPENFRIETGDSLTETEMHRLRKYTHSALRKTDYLKCRSAFGGVGVYRYDAIGESHYRVEENTRSQKFDYLCEHIPFNREVSTKGTLYICRNMKVYYEQISFKIWLKAWALDHNMDKQLQKIKGLYHKIDICSSSSGRKSR